METNGTAWWRLPLLAGGGAALVAGLYAGVLLLGFPLPVPRPALADVHGPVLVLGFVGTLVALERAVALGARWALAAPACSAAGALAWYAAALLWLAGTSVPELVPWLATVVVATIAGERLEPAHVAGPGPAAERWFLAATAVLVAGATAATLWPDAGPSLFGAGLLAVVAWLAVHDVARRTVHGRGLPRYAAVALLTGYGWLALAGLLWAGATNVAAVIAFVACAVTLAVRAAHRRPTGAAGDPAPARVPA